ncbi:MAG: hypothetical protein JWP97_4350 [Labilithrix sp.]|nr:hypothetical protein [Labilithrix sp.]
MSSGRAYPSATMRALATPLLVILAALATSCRAPLVAPQPGGDAATTTPTPWTTTERASWLCRPDLPTDPCRSADLSATVLAPDGTRTVIPHQAEPHPAVDCFYVYPTVDLELVPGNHLDLGDVRKERAVTLAQAARFGEACALWVPLYRQVTIGTYLQPKDVLEKGLAFGFADIERAFREYLAASPPTRPIVLVGHSQGAEMVMRLLRHFFDDDPALRARLLLAMPIGTGVDVARGTAFGSSRAVPPCTRPRQTGCLVAYRTYSDEGHGERQPWAMAADHEAVCVNPATLDVPDAAPDATGLLAGASFPREGNYGARLRGIDGVTTPFVEWRSFYRARCVRSTNGMAWLEVTAPASPPGPVDLHDPRFRLAQLGLHVLDMQLAQGDLVELVRRRIANRRE